MGTLCKCDRRRSKPDRCAGDNAAVGIAPAYEMHGRGRRFDPCIAHQEVRGNSAAFLVSLGPRPFRGLAEAVSVSTRMFDAFRAAAARKACAVSSVRIPFPEFAAGDRQDLIARGSERSKNRGPHPTGRRYPAGRGNLCARGAVKREMHTNGVSLMVHGFCGRCSDTPSMGKYS